MYVTRRTSNKKIGHYETNNKKHRFAEISMELIYILEKCPNFNKMIEAGNSASLLLEWGGRKENATNVMQPTTSEDSLELEHKKNYELTTYWAGLRVEFDSYWNRLVVAIRRAKNFSKSFEDGFVLRFYYSLFIY